jgi:hypothetical protein
VVVSNGVQIAGRIAKGVIRFESISGAADIAPFLIEEGTFCPTAGRFSFQISVRVPPDPTTLSQNEGLRFSTDL